jgi:hypothetical protein
MSGFFAGIHFAEFERVYTNAAPARQCLQCREYLRWSSIQAPIAKPAPLLDLTARLSQP